MRPFHPSAFILFCGASIGDDYTRRVIWGPISARLGTGHRLRHGALWMSDPSSKDQRAPLWVSRWLTVILAVSAACAIGFGAVLAYSQEDAEALESPLLMSAAH